MAYITADNVRLLTAQITGKDLSTSDIEQFIEYAESEIHSKLEGIYTVPFIANIPMINFVDTYLASGYCLRLLYTGAGRNKSEYGEMLIKQGQEMLYEICEVKCKLMDDTGIVIEPMGGRTTDEPVYVSNTNDVEYYMPTFDEDY